MDHLNSPHSLQTVTNQWSDSAFQKQEAENMSDRETNRCCRYCRHCDRLTRWQDEVAPK